MSDITPERRKPWILVWATDEDFWKQFAAQFLAGLLLLLVGIVGVVVSGVLPPTDFLRWLISIGFVVIQLLLTVLVAISFGRRAMRARFLLRLRKWERRLGILVSGLFGALVVTIAGVILSFLIAQWLASW